MKGVLGRVNVHDRAQFFIYPEFGEGSVECHFDADKFMSKVRQALGCLVIADGVMEYIGSDLNPTSAFIQDIDIVPEDYQIPLVSRFSGIAPNLTGDFEIDQFITEVRNGW